MTEQARCEPREADRGRDGWHWVKGPYSTGPLQWIASTVGQWSCPGREDMSAEECAAIGCTYLRPVSPHDPADIARLVEAATKTRRAVGALYMNRHAGRQLREWSVKNITDLSNDLDTALAAFTAKEI